MLLCITSSLPTFAMTNFITNYTRNEYKAGSQNWQIMQDDVTSWMYFANKMGILEFNGLDWNLHRFNNQSEGRTLLKSTRNNRIYVAGVNEFGYLAPDKTGHMNYICIASDAVDNEIRFGNIWKIYEIDNSLYFCADNLIVKLVGDKITIIPCPYKIDCSTVVNNTLYVGTDSGIYVLAGENLYYLSQSECVRSQKIREMLPFKGKVLIATALNGLFLMDEKKVVSFKTESDDFLRRNELFSITVGEDKIAIGTILKGVVLISYNGKILNYFNESYGLCNNTVLTAYFDNQNNLWLGLDNGIAYINIKSPITNLYLSPNFYGSGYAAELYDGRLYLGTNQGLYYVDFPIPLSENAIKLHLVENMQGQVWGLKELDGELICCLDRGLFSIKNRKVKKMDIKTGVWKFEPTKQNKNKAWVSTYNGFYIMEKKGGNWTNPRHIPDYVGSAFNFQEEKNGVLFIRNNWNELLRVNLNDSLSKITENKLFNVPSIPSHFFISQTDDGIKLCSSKGFFGYNTNKNFEADKNLNQIFYDNGQQPYHGLIERENVLWALGENVVCAYLKQNNKLVSHTHNISLVSGFESMYPLNDSSLVLPNENGFAFWNVKMSDSYSERGKLQIIHIKSTRSSDSLIHVKSNIKGKKDFEFAYKHNSLSFYFNKLDYGNKQSTLYRCRMDNNPWSDYSLSNTREYSGLSAGKHIFRVETLLNDGRVLHDEFSFTILSPWYLTKWAYACYFVLSLLLLYFLWYLDDLRIKRKRIQIIKKERQKMAAKEEEYRLDSEKKEKEIVRLQNEQLEMEVQHKNHELANVAINVARKNETLIEIKTDLLQVSNSLKHSNPDLTVLRRIILRINNKIEDNILLDDMFRKFEKHFDLVHNNLIKNLSEQYPSLTLNERKMCAFIKMQLSSKEMAPLLNISLRGVETLRYRLRKKFGLSREDSLTIFLNNFEV